MFGNNCELKISLVHNLASTFVSSKAKLVHTEDVSGVNNVFERMQSENQAILFTNFSTVLSFLVKSKTFNFTNPPLSIMLS